MKKFLAKLLAFILFLSALAPAAYAVSVFYWKITADKAELPAATFLNQFFAYGDGSEVKAGDGSVTGPFGITQPKHFYNLSKLNSIGYLAKTYHYEISAALQGPVDMTGVPAIAPIGSEEYPFYGKFNGNDKSLSNITIASGTNDSAGGWSEFDDIGVFGYIAPGAEVSHLILDEPVISSTVTGTGARAPLGGITTADYTVAFLPDGRLQVEKAASSAAPSDCYFVFRTSDKTVLPVYLSGQYYVAEAGADGAAELAVLACRKENGVECARVIAKYAVTVSGGTIAPLPAAAPAETHTEKHIGLFAGHIEGSADLISVYGGRMSAASAAHYSQLGLIGFVGENATVMGNINEYLPDGSATGDTGYLYADYLMGAIGKPIRWPGVAELGENPELEYPLAGTQNYLAGSISTSNANTIGFSAGRYIGGFGIFALNTSDRAGNTQVTRLGAANLDSFRFQGVYSMGATAGATTLVTAETDYPAAGATVRLNDEFSPFELDNEKNQYLRSQIINTFPKQAYNDYEFGARIQSFNFGFAFTYDLSNNNIIQRVHDYTGNVLNPPQNIDNATNETLTFTIRESNYYATDESLPANIDTVGGVKFDRTKYVDIIVASYTNATASSHFFLRMNFSDKNTYTELMSNMNNYASSSYNIYVFRVTYASFRASMNSTQAATRGRYTIMSSNGSNSNFTTTRYLYLAVGGQVKGTGGSGERGLVEKIDFVYKRDGQIVPVTGSGYRYSRVVVEITGMIPSGGYTFSFIREYVNDTTPISFTVTHTGGAYLRKWPYSSGTVVFSPPVTGPPP